jgi:hypothetical protein
MGWDLASSSLSEDLFNYRLYTRLGEEGWKRLFPDWQATRSYVYPEFVLTDEAFKGGSGFRLIGR